MEFSVRALHLHNFRKYKDEIFEFTPVVNTINGPNAHGKTTILEALYFLSTGRSFRTSQTTDLIKHGASGFCIEAGFVKSGIEQKLRVHYSSTERRVMHNATTFPHLSSLLGLLPSVVMHPGDEALIKGPPATRRQLLDTLLAQSDPLYVHHLTRYSRAMRQRNHLLRSKTEASIDSWEYEMANAAAYLVPRRARAAVFLDVHSKNHYALLSGDGETLQIAYKAHGAGDNITLESATLRNMYCDQYRRHRTREMQLGATLTGPHKDELVITLDGKEARAFGSEGQQRSCIAALRLAEWDQLGAMAQQKPLMLIDDLGISLDAARCQKLIDYFAQLGQVVVTTQL